MRLCFLEDRAEFLEPLTLTRPVFDLVCGCGTLADKLIRLVRPDEIGGLVRPYLEQVTQQRHPTWAINDASWLADGPVLLVNPRWLPARSMFLDPQPGCVGVIDDELAYVYLSGDDAQSLDVANWQIQLEELKRTLPCHDAGGVFVRFPWDLVQHNGREIERDFPGPLGPTPTGLIGSAHHLYLHPSAKIDPFVVFDTTQGPVMVQKDAVIGAFTKLEGPCVIGPSSQLLGAKVRAGTTIGPQCRIGGEVEASIVHGYSNKYHEGFLGHAYVGKWCNLGAGTHNSDLRNDYGEVTVTVHGQAIGTGLSKVGCFLGDHVRTGLGTLINTGTNVGVFCQLLPAGRLAPKYMPSFTNWWNGGIAEGFDIDKLWSIAETVSNRRHVILSAAERDLMLYLHQVTWSERRRVLLDVESRALRRSA